MCLQAVESVLSGRVQRAFAVVRPPGHHAECTRAMGFCFFNSVAASALVAHRQLGARRVLVLDWDIHHGELRFVTASHIGDCTVHSGAPVPPLEVCRIVGPCWVLQWDMQESERG